MEDLFYYSLLRLQIEELLKEVTLKEMKKIDAFLHEINSLLSAIPETSETEEIFQDKDNLNQHCHWKSALYLARIAQHFSKEKLFGSVKFAYMNSKHLKPILLLRPQGMRRWSPSDSMPVLSRVSSNPAASIPARTTSRQLDSWSRAPPKKEPTSPRPRTTTPSSATRCSCPTCTSCLAQPSTSRV